ncbi:MAG TPA: hypothetical protein ENI67_04780 [Gammaproteobacteria bacterium]|nr:hypothetical protein [Gammaproteobacteria bacterium]
MDATGKWTWILSSLGLSDRQLSNKHGPCPACGGKDRYRFDNKNSEGTYYCNQCGPGNGWSLIKKLYHCSFNEALRMVDKLTGTPKYEAPPKQIDPKLRLHRIAKSLQKIVVGDPVDLYLKSRGITNIPDCLWYLPQITSEGITHCAMVAIISDGKPISYHVTYLTKTGKKANIKVQKKILPPLRTIKGAAIRLYDEPGGQLNVAEGIETALSVHDKFSGATWSTITAGGMASLIVPDCYTSITIWGDNDASYTGQKAAYALAKRIVNAGKTVNVCIPRRVGDWADDK